MLEGSIFSSPEPKRRRMSSRMREVVAAAEAVARTGREVVIVVKSKTRAWAVRRMLVKGSVIPVNTVKGFGGWDRTTVCGNIPITARVFMDDETRERFMREVWDI